MADLSDAHQFTMNVFTGKADFLESSYERFYEPTEVNGQPAVSISGEKLDAYEALFAFESEEEPQIPKDPF